MVGEGSEPFFLSRRRSGSESARVVGVVVVPGKPRSWPLCAAGGVEAACLLSSARSPALPHPWPGWAAVSVGNSLPPGQPSGPTLQLSNSQAASRQCRRFAAPALKLRPQAAASQACAWLRIAAALLASLSLRFHPSAPALPCSPLAVERLGITAGEKRLGCCSACFVFEQRLPCHQCLDGVEHRLLSAAWQAVELFEQLLGTARRAVASRFRLLAA